MNMSEPRNICAAVLLDDTKELKHWTQLPCDEPLESAIFDIQLSNKLDSCLPNSLFNNIFFN